MNLESKHHKRCKLNRQIFFYCDNRAICGDERKKRGGMKGRICCSLQNVREKKRKRIFFPNKYPFINVNNLQSFNSYVLGGGNNHFGGWKCQKGMPFFMVVSEVVHKARNWWPRANLSLESHWPFKVWTMSNQILFTNLVGEALTWWKTREHRAFQI